MALSLEERQRYARQLSLPGVGAEGQEQLAAARVLVIGAGGLGSPVAMYLAAAGVGTLGIVDFDTVDRSNLHRQLLHGTTDVGRPKVESAVDALHEINPHVQVHAHRAQLTSANALSLLGDYDVVVDGSDNFPTRYLVNDACGLLGRTLVYGSVQRFEGQASVFGGDGPCYRCLFREPPPPGLVPSCAEAGVFGVMPGLIGLVQATETIKLIVGLGTSLRGRLMLWDVLTMRQRIIELRRDPQCPLCGTREITGLIDYDAFCGVTPPPPAGAASAGGIARVSPTELASWYGTGREFTVIDVREPWEYDLARLPGSTLVPLGQIAQAASSLPRDRDLVLLCHHGVRSLSAAQLLATRGFTRLFNVTGGIDRWSTTVDAAVPRY
ncbi:MAG: molybdopterin-synthase adenylyltransferase MoeB [Gemmatimonadaceae bacterium]|nr:molybdopterin-synthase adenylyltransferase MoeB [Gemmatimonadaceae bacterium]